MSSDPGEADDYCSAASVSGVVICLWVEIELVRDLLGGWGRPVAHRKGPSGKHPIRIELWRVQSGEVFAWRSAPWRPFGWWLQGPAGAVLSRYGEVMVGVPDVALVGRAGRPRRTASSYEEPRFMFVARMYTNSPISLWGDQALQFGYRKRLARISDNEHGGYRLEGMIDGSTLLTADLRSARGTSAEPPHHVEWSRQALLGRLAERQFAVSSLERVSVAPVVPVSGALTIGPRFLDGLLAGQHVVEPLDASHPWGGFAFSDVRMLLTYPEHGSPERDFKLARAAGARPPERERRDPR